MRQFQGVLTSNSVAIILLGIGLIAASFASIFISFAEQELSSTAVVFNRLWITSVIYAVWIGLQKIYAFFHKSSPKNLPEDANLIEQHNILRSIRSTLTWDPKILMILLMIGFCFCANQVIWSWSLEHTRIANSTILHNLTPIFTILGARIFLNQQFDQRFILGAGVSILGAIAIEIEDLHFGFELFQGDIAALGSAIFYSSYLLEMNRLRNQLGIVNIILGYSLVGTCLVIPLLVIQQDVFFPHSIQAWLSVIALALVCQVCGQALIAHCLRKISVGIVSLAHLLCPCMTAMEAWFILGEGLSIKNLLGFVTVLTGLYYGISRSTQA